MTNRRRVVRKAAMTMAAARLGVFGRAEPPLANLASWRLGRAAEWLYSPRLTPARGKG